MQATIQWPLLDKITVITLTTLEKQRMMLSGGLCREVIIGNLMDKRSLQFVKRLPSWMVFGDSVYG
jgi:hypothetical protein